MQAVTANESIEKLKEIKEIKELSINKKPTYVKEIDLLQITRKIQELYEIPPKSRVQYQELAIMIGLVLETGKNGTKTIRNYAESMGKTEN